MEDDSYLRMLLASNPPPLGSQSSSISVPITSIPSRPPLPVSSARACVPERQWSSPAIKFLLLQCKEHVEAHNMVTMQQHQWERIHKLLIAQFPHKAGRKVKSLSDKWEKLRSTYSKIKKSQNQTSTGAQDYGAKFIWYDDIDEILSLTAKTNGVPGGMDQGIPVPGTSTSTLLSSSSAPPNVATIATMTILHECNPLRALIQHHPLGLITRVVAAVHGHVQLNYLDVVVKVFRDHPRGQKLT